MLEKISTQGYWWSEADSDNTVPGELTYEPDGRITLKLLSPIRNTEEHLSTGSVVEYDRIHGVTEDGKEVTLLNCTQSNTSFSFDNSGIQTSEYVAASFIRGYAFTQGEDIEFQTATVEYPLLDQWAGISGVSIDYGFDEGEEGEPITIDAGDTVQIEYEFQDSHESDVGEYTVALSVNADLNQQRVGGFSIDETTQFRIDPHDSGISLDDLMDAVNKLQNFVTIAVRKPTFPSKLEGKVATNGEFDESVEIVFDQLPEMDPPTRVHPYKTNFTFADIYENFAEILRTWFDLYSELKPTYDLYFGTKHNNDMYPRNKFLGLTQALETYHRHSEYDDEYLEEPQFEEYYEDLCESIPEEFPNSFRDHLSDGTFKYANEYSLRKRLDKLVKDHEEVLADLPWDIGEQVNSITNTRNNLTHRGGPTVDVTELYEMNLIMESLLEACLLTDLGIPKDHLTERLGERYDELARGV